jgi:hypothetical protein
MNIRQLHLKFPADVTRPEVEAALKKVFSAWGRMGGRAAKVTELRKKSARELMYTINSRRKLMKDLHLDTGGVEHVYYNENDPMVKELLALKAKVTNLEQLTKKKTVKSSSRARGKITKKRGSHEP